MLSIKQELLDKFTNLESDFLDMAKELKEALGEFNVNTMFSELLAEKKRNITGIAVINFLLDNTEFQHVNDFKKELPEQENGHTTFVKPTFPLNENSLVVLKAMIQKNLLVYQI